MSASATILHSGLQEKLKNAVLVTPIVHIGQLDTLMALYWSLGWTGLCIRDQKVPFTWLQFTSAVCWTGTWEQQHDKTAKDDTTYWLKFSPTVFFRLLLVLFMLLFDCLRDDGWRGERGMRDYIHQRPSALGVHGRRLNPHATKANSINLFWQR